MVPQILQGQPLRRGLPFGGLQDPMIVNPATGEVKPITPSRRDADDLGSTNPTPSSLLQMNKPPAENPVVTRRPAEGSTEPPARKAASRPTILNEIDPVAGDLGGRKSKEQPTRRKTAVVSPETTKRARGSVKLQQVARDWVRSAKDGRRDAQISDRRYYPLVSESPARAKEKRDNPMWRVHRELECPPAICLV